MFRSFPLMFFAVVIYNLIWAGTWATHSGMVALPGVPTSTGVLNAGITLTMFSGDMWKFSLGDLLILVSLCLLFIELVKATRTNSTEIINHALSMVVFIIALVEFIVVKGFSTSTFFFIMVMCLFDIVAGFTISIVAAKRDLGTPVSGILGTN